MKVELFTDGDWRHTKLLVDGKMEPYVTKIGIFVENEKQATIEVCKSIDGTVPYGHLATIKGLRSKIDSSGPSIDDEGNIVSENFEYNDVIIREVS